MMLLAHRDHLHAAVHCVQDAVCANPAGRLAHEAHVTPRRRLRQALGTGGTQY